MSQHIHDLLKAQTNTAPDMTHGLCVLGNGSMRSGIKKLWLNGYGSGAATTAIVLGGGYLIYRLASNQWRRLNMVNNLGVAYNMGFEAGKCHNSTATGESKTEGNENGGNEDANVSILQQSL